MAVEQPSVGPFWVQGAVWLHLPVEPYCVLGLLLHHWQCLPTLPLLTVWLGSPWWLLLFISSLSDVIQSLSFKYHFFGYYIQIYTCSPDLSSELKLYIIKLATWPFQVYKGILYLTLNVPHPLVPPPAILTHDSLHHWTQEFSLIIFWLLESIPLTLYKTQLSNISQIQPLLSTDVGRNLRRYYLFPEMLSWSPNQTPCFCFFSVVPSTHSSLNDLCKMIIISRILCLHLFNGFLAHPI